VLFTELAPHTLGPLDLDLPVLASFTWRPAALAGLAALLLFALRWNLLAVVGACALGGLALG
jgi:chromate transporter